MSDDALQIEDMQNAKLDTITISEVAMVDYTEDTATNRNGDVIDTLTGRLKKLGFEVPVTYAGGISFTVNDSAKTVDEAGVIYSPLPSALPFTTSGTWGGDDDARFQIVQNTNQTQVDDNSTAITDLQTLSGVSANDTDLGTFTGNIISDNVDNKVALQELESASENNATNISANADAIAVNAANIASIGGAIVAPNQKGGLEVAYGSITTNTVTSGICADRFASSLLIGSAATLDISSDIGTGGNAAFPSALTLSPDTDYHIMLVTKEDGTGQRYSYDVDIDATNALAAWTAEEGESYTLYRRIRSIKTNGSSEIIEDFQRGNKIYRALPISLAADGASPPTTSTPLTCETPLGIECEVVLQSQIRTSGGSAAEVSLQIEDLNASGFYTVNFAQSEGGTSNSVSVEFYAVTDSTKKLNYLYVNATNFVTSTIFQRCYIDLFNE